MPSISQDFSQLANPDYSIYIHRSRYARWSNYLGRRENWQETVTRYCDFWKKKYPDIFPYEHIYNAIYNLDCVPSMRALMTAGEALERDNIAGFNCSFIPILDTRCFDEVMFILMNGTGVGYSVERQYVSRLPDVAESFHRTDTEISVADSKQGWAAALRQLISLLYSGQIPRWDVSKVRPAGARLKTFGGRASGPKPLEELFTFAVALFSKAAGRKLTSVECSDLVCKIAEVVVVGGVRRSALICLSDLSDEGMSRYKSVYKIDEYVLINETDTEWHYAITMKKNQPCHPTYKVILNKKNDLYSQQQLEVDKSIGWWLIEKQRALANISAAYAERPDIGTFMKEWQALYESKSGERGIFNRVSAQKQAARNGRRDANQEFGTNPCGEIILPPFGFC